MPNRQASEYKGLGYKQTLYTVIKRVEIILQKTITFPHKFHNYKIWHIAIIFIAVKVFFQITPYFFKRLVFYHFAIY